MLLVSPDIVSEFIQSLETDRTYFAHTHTETDDRDGWKLSIQGTSMDDIAYLFEHLILFLNATNVSYKFATRKLLNYQGARTDQKHKLLTIYVPNNVDAKSFAELLWLNIKDYKGGEGITPMGYNHYKGAIWYRNDRTEDGAYIMPDSVLAKGNVNNG